MVKFVELENGRLFNAAHIMEIGTVSKIDYETKTTKLRVIISIRILGTDGSWRELINEETVIPFIHAKLPEWFYDFVGSEIDKLEEIANSLLTHEVHKMCIEGMKVYHPGDDIRRRLQDVAKDSAEFIEETTQKNEDE